MNHNKHRSHWWDCEACSRQVYMRQIIEGTQPMLKYGPFAYNLEAMQREADRESGRVHNMDNFGHWLRVLSRRLTFVFFVVGLRGPHILFAHFAVDLAALYSVATGHPILAGVLWITSYILDNCDGDLARARAEARPEWGDVDNLFHTWSSMIFWLVLGVITPGGLAVATVIALRVIMEHHRGGYQKTGDRYGEKSRLWSWIVLPTDITIMYLAYIPFALAGYLEWYIYGYLLYYLTATLGQGAVLLRKAVKA